MTLAPNVVKYENLNTSQVYRLGPLRISTHIVRGGLLYDWR
jgi:hypothetical protein